MTRSLVATLVGALDVFEGKFLLRFSDLLSADQASTMLFVEEPESGFPAALTKPAA